MTEALTMRPGVPTQSDGDAFADYLSQTDPEYLKAVFGTHMQRIYAMVYQVPGTLHSHDKVLFAERDGETVAMMNGFTAAQYYDAIAMTSREILRAAGWLVGMRIALVGGFFELRGIKMRSLKPGTYYVQALTVDASQRGRGVGQQMLQAATQRATALQCSILALDVNAENQRAVGAYEKFGLRVTGPGAFTRMEKQL